jgi:integrase
LARYWHPNTEYEAKRAVNALIDHLKGLGKKAVAEAAGIAGMDMIAFLEDFWSPDGRYVREKKNVDNEPLSAHYIKNMAANTRNHIKPFPGFKGITVSGLTKSLLRDYKLWMSERGCSGRVINTSLQAMSVPIRDAWKDDLIADDPFHGLRLAHHEKKEKGVVTPAEMLKLEASPITDIYARLAVLLAARCGMRMGEVRGLQWEDIADGMITIRHNWIDDEGMKNPKRKGGLVRQNTRRVPLVKVVADALDILQKQSEYTRPDDFVLSRERGHPIRKRFFQCGDHKEKMMKKGKSKGKVVDKIACGVTRELASIGITPAEQKARNLTFHGLRHTFVTLGRLAGLTDAEIQALAGHADGRMMENYSHVDQVIDFAAMREKLERKTG